jgi:uncharacterized protein (PEP-CTERM system associated)
VNHRLDNQRSVFGRVGYESNDVDTTRDDTDGLTWALGGTWRPNPRTDLAATFEERYFGKDVSVKFGHVTRRTGLVASYTRTVDNARNAIQEALVGPEGANEPFPNPVTGEPEPELFLVPELIDEDFLAESFRLGANLSGRRHSIGLQATWTKRDYEISGNDEDSFGLTANLSRRLSPLSSGTARFSREQTKPETGVDRSTYLVGLSFSRRLGRFSSFNFDVSHRRQDGIDGDSFEENRVSAGFTTSLW